MQRRTFVIPVAALAGAAALYGAGWLYVAHLVDGQIAAWAEAQRAQGWQVRYGRVDVEGFPFAVRARIERPSADAPPPTDRHFATDLLYARYAPWRPDRVALRAPTPVRIDWGGLAPGRAVLDRTSAIATMGPKGRLKELALTVDKAEIASPASAAPARVDKVTAHARAGGRDPAGTPGHRRLAYAVRGELLGLTLPDGVNPPLGRTLARLALDMELRGEPPPAPGNAAMAAWRDGGGTMEVKRFGLGWGPLKAEGDGTLALDRQMRPEGALTARISGFQQTVDTLVSAGILPPRHGVLIGYALKALAKTPAGGGPPVIEAPVTMQSGKLFIGPVALMPLPAINWN